MTDFNKVLLLAIVIAAMIMGFVRMYDEGFSDGVTSVDNQFSKIQNEWLYKTVVATGDYFDSNGTKFRGEVVAVTVRPWGTFITVYNRSTGILYPKESIEYFNRIEENK